MDMNLKPLKFLAQDHQDLQIVAAHLQDALLPITAMVHDTKTSTFCLLAKRFCWEHEEMHHEGQPLYHRVHSGICFMNVKSVHHRGFDLMSKKRVLNLMTMHSDGATIHMVFSGENEIRIEVDKLHCHVGDLHHPWPTRKRPVHLFEHVEQHAKPITWN